MFEQMGGAAHSQMSDAVHTSISRLPRPDLEQIAFNQILTRLPLTRFNMDAVNPIYMFHIFKPCYAHSQNI